MYGATTIIIQIMQYIFSSFTRFVICSLTTVFQQQWTNIRNCFMISFIYGLTNIFNHIRQHFSSSFTRFVIYSLTTIFRPYLRTACHKRYMKWLEDRVDEIGGKSDAVIGLIKFVLFNDSSIWSSANIIICFIKRIVYDPSGRSLISNHTALSPWRLYMTTRLGRRRVLLIPGLV